MLDDEVGAMSRMLGRAGFMVVVATASGMTMLNLRRNRSVLSNGRGNQGESIA